MKQALLAFIIIATSMMCNANKTSQQLDSLFASRYGDCSDSPGAAVLIAKGDTVIYERYFGLADIATHQQVTASTLFNIASVSKQFTVVALLQQQGIDLDTPLSHFFNYPQDFWSRITLRHLASHTSGIPDERDRSDRQRCVLANETTSAAYFPTVKALKFEPGTDYDYLNPSFILLARVVQQVTGQDFYQYQQTHIFNVAGMTSTCYFSPAGMPAEAAHAYVANASGGWSEYDYGEETFFATRPDGGIYSTARDMLRWELALAGGIILPNDVLQQAYTPQVSVSNSKWCDYQRRPHTYYALGWFVESQPGKPVKVYHTGDNGGFQAYVAKYPELGWSIIVLENRNDLDRWQMATAIDRILLQ